MNFSFLLIFTTTPLPNFLWWTWLFTDNASNRALKSISACDICETDKRATLSYFADGTTFFSDDLVRINVSNYQNPSLYFWTRVGEKLFENTKFQIDYDVVQKHFNGQITVDEFAIIIFKLQKEISGIQAEPLG